MGGSTVLSRTFIIEKKREIKNSKKNCYSLLEDFNTESALLCSHLLEKNPEKHSHVLIKTTTHT